MAEELQGGAALTSTPSPMDQEMQKLRTDPRVTMHLLPLPKHAAGVASKKPPEKPSGSAPTSMVKKPKKKATKSSCPATGVQAKRCRRCIHLLEVQHEVWLPGNGFQQQVQERCAQVYQMRQGQPQLGEGLHAQQNSIEDVPDMFVWGTDESPKGATSRPQAPSLHTPQDQQVLPSKRACLEPPCLPKDRFQGKDVSRLLFVEVFAGTGRVSKVFRDAGFRMLPIDNDASRASVLHIAKYNLAAESGLRDLQQLLEEEQDDICYVHFAPACGTASRARERPLPRLGAQGYRVAKPLRSKEFRLRCKTSRTWTKFVQRQQILCVTTCGTWYSGACNETLLALLKTLQIRFYGTLTSWKHSLTADSLAFLTAVVMEDLERKRRSGGVLCNWFAELAVRCDDGHPHLPWKPRITATGLKYPTAEEAAYPILLCERVASTVRDKLLELGAVIIHDLAQQVEQSTASLHRFLLEILPRRKWYKPLVSEYGQYCKFACLLDEPDVQMQLAASFGKGCKVVGRRIAEWGKIRDESENVFSKGLLEQSRELHAGSNVQLLQVGQPRKPLDFVQEAVQKGHPRAFSIHLPEAVQQVLRENLHGNAFDLAKKRIQYLWKWSSRATELKQAEAEHKARMPPHLAELLRNKRLLLLQEMLEDLDYPDKELVKDISEGFKLTGWLKASGVFPKAVRQAQYSVETLRLLSKGLNAAILAQLEPTSDVEQVAVGAWEQTLEELEKGYVWRDETCSPDSFVLIWFAAEKGNPSD